MSTVYEVITSRITDMMEKNKQAPWVKPWDSGMPLGASQNLVTGHKYQGINSILTMGEETPFFATFKQIKELGASLRAGSKSIPIVFWASKKSEDTDKDFLFARYYRVFNSSAIDGLPEKYLAKVQPKPVTEKHIPQIEQAEKVIAETKADVRFIDNTRAFYSPTLDYINLPKRELFNSSNEFYSVAFHELGHWTGHESRLKRKDLLESNYFGSHSYSREELTAELCAAFVCSSLNISTESTERNSAAYLNNWLRVLKNDPKMIVHASQRAQKAANLILKIEKESAE
jgi:antirestriction protein ArdC